MLPETLDLRTLSPASRLAAGETALRTLRAGRLVLAPGDTGYLLLTPLAGPVAADLARTARPATLLPGTSTDALSLIPHSHAIARKLIRTLTPGPAVLRVQLAEADLSMARDTLALAPEIADHTDELHLRVLGPSAAATLQGSLGTPVLAWEPTDDAGRSFIRETDTLAAASAAGLTPAIVLADAAPTAGGARRRPTTIAVSRTGGVRIVTEGAFEERYVLKHAQLNILMVCTGNTCRSPMAEAIAQGIVTKTDRGGAPGPIISITSAGTGAGAGSPHTPEGNQAVRRLGYSPTSTRSRPLTRELIEQSDLIYAMARSNLASVIGVDPRARMITELLDPDGEDVPDPIGMPQQAYNETARRIEAMILERLKEWRS